jgi:hypothetical protein
MFIQTVRMYYPFTFAPFNAFEFLSRTPSPEFSGQLLG